jgi:EmrB/QacA subfamily drug resistance transporter
MLMIVLDATVVNVALPAIQSDLRFSPASLAWVVNAYLVSFGGLLLLAGRLGDLVSRRRVFLWGLAVFTVSSFLCGVSNSQAVLVVMRFVQGVGGALTSAVILGMIVTMFPEPREQAKAIGFYSFVASAGGSVGLLAGGVLTQLLSWHWIFFVNVPIGVVAVLVARRVLEDDRGLGLGSGADVLGAVLVTSSLVLGVFTVVEPAARYGWTSPVTLASLAGSSLLLGLFVLREATAATPLVPLRVFAVRAVWGANVIQALTVAGVFGMFFLGVLYEQQVLHYDELATGLSYLPMTLVMAAMSVRYSERLVARLGAGRVLVAGLVLTAAGLAWFARVPADGTFLVDLLPSGLLIGLGVGGCFPALMTLAMSGATADDAGLASGLVATTAQVGGAIGLAVLATLSAGRTRQLGDAGASVPDALLGGYHLGFAVAAGLVAVAVAVAAVVLRPRREAGADPAPLR